MYLSKPLIYLNDVNAQGITGDCACSEASNSPPSQSINTDLPIENSRVYKCHLPHNHTFLLSATAHAGGAVLNEPAMQIWKQFQTPRYINDVFSDDNSLLPMINKMGTAGLLTNAKPQYDLQEDSETVLSAWIHVTNRCNLRCDYCYVNKSNEDMSANKGGEAVDAILRSAIRHEMSKIKLKYSGGEATLNLKRVLEIHDNAVKQANKCGIQLEATLLSNGVSVQHNDIIEIKARRIDLCISLDGIGEGHDVQRKFSNNHGSFALVSRNIDKLIGMGIYPFISITLSNRNAENLYKVVEFVLDRHLRFNINFFRENDNTASDDNLQFQDDEKIIDGILRAFSIIEQKLPEYSLLTSLIDRAQFDRQHKQTCGVGNTYMVIDHKGNISKCQMEMDRPLTSVESEDPLAILQADQTSILNVSVEDKEGCRDCHWKYWCSGGCPAQTYRSTGKYHVRSPHCGIYQAIFPELLRLEGLRIMKLAKLL